MATRWLPAGVRKRGLTALHGKPKAASIAFNEQRYLDALKLWRKLAERGPGDGEAEFRLGQLYRTGRGVFMNFAEAAHWYERASLRGHLAAKLDLARLLLSGASDADAKRFRELRRDPASPASTTLTTLLYPYGDKVEADAEKAAALLEEVAASGEADAMELLA